jgi:asparagine synthase (glutamine-hydrolysing)
MSGILGIWNLDGRPVEKEVLSGMSATLAHRGPDGESQWIDGAVGLACQLMRVTPESLHETQPLVHPSGAVVVFDGRLDNREELLGLLKGAWGAEPDSPDPALVLAAYDAFGDRFPERLNGDFALAVFDPRRQQLLLARDVIGLRPLYYHRIGDTFLFVSEIKAILAHPQVSPRPNDNMVAEFLTQTFSQSSQAETFYSSIFRIVPGHLLLLTPRGLLTRQHWDFDPQARIRLRSYQEYIEGYRSLFEQAVHRRMRSLYPVGVSVSGGLDSSSIFCQAETTRRQKPNFYPQVLGFSFLGPEGSWADETEFIRKIEELYSIRIGLLPIGPLHHASDLEKEAWYMESPFLAWEAHHKLLQISQSKGSRVFLTGHWGDEILGGQGYLIDLFIRLRWREVYLHLKEPFAWMTDRTLYNCHFLKDSLQFGKDLLKFYIPDNLYNRLRLAKFRLFSFPNSLPWHTKILQELALRHLARKIEPKGGFATAHQKNLSLNIKRCYNYFRIEVLSKLAAMYGMEFALPFLDRDLVYYMLAIPGEMGEWQGIPKAIHRAAMKNILPQAIRDRRWKGDFTKLAYEGMEVDRARLVAYLQKGMMAVRFGYVDEGKVQKELNGLNRPIDGYIAKFVVARNLEYLFGLEVWLQVFFSGRK